MVLKPVSLDWLSHCLLPVDLIIIFLPVCKKKESRKLNSVKIKW